MYDSDRPEDEEVKIYTVLLIAGMVCMWNVLTNKRLIYESFNTPIKAEQYK